MINQQVFNAISNGIPNKSYFKIAARNNGIQKQSYKSNIQITEQF